MVVPVMKINHNFTVHIIKMRHKWKDNICVKCGSVREYKTIRYTMAIVGSKTYYKYERVTLYNNSLQYMPCFVTTKKINH